MDCYIPKLKDGIVINDFDSSSEEITYVLVYDDRYWHISEYLRTIIYYIDGNKNIEQIAQSVSEDIGIEVKNENITKVIDVFLKEKGLLVGTENDSKRVKGSFLWLKIPLIKASWVQKFDFISVLYRPIIMCFLSFLIVSAFFAVFVELVKGNLGIKIDNRGYIIILGILIFSGFVHEFGHSCACMRYNLKPGEIGFAFFFIFPVLYSDVTCAWLLKRRQRVLVDLGGFYLQLSVLSILGIIGTVFDINIMKILAAMGLFSVFENLNPIIKMDGYWVISDMLGIPNLHKVSSQTIKNLVLRLFGVNPQIGMIEYISKKEKICLLIYVVFFSVFFSYMIFMIMNFVIYMPGMILERLSVFQNGALSINDYASGILNIVFTLIIGVLIIKVIYSVFSNLIKETINIVKLIISEKNKYNNELHKSKRAS